MALQIPSPPFPPSSKGLPSILATIQAAPIQNPAKSLQNSLGNGYPSPASTPGIEDYKLQGSDILTAGPSRNARESGKGKNGWRCLGMDAGLGAAEDARLAGVGWLMPVWGQLAELMAPLLHMVGGFRRPQINHLDAVSRVVPCGNVVYIIYIFYVSRILYRSQQ